MDFQVNMNICRICLKCGQGASLIDDLDLQSKFTFVTQFTINSTDNMPSLICDNCILRLKLSYEFIKLAQTSENNLRAFLSKINTDFLLVAKTSNTYENVESLSGMIEYQTLVAPQNKREKLGDNSIKNISFLRRKVNENEKDLPEEEIILEDENMEHDSDYSVFNSLNVHIENALTNDLNTSDSENADRATERRIIQVPKSEVVLDDEEISEAEDETSEKDHQNIIFLDNQNQKELITEKLYNRDIVEFVDDNSIVMEEMYLYETSDEANKFQAADDDDDNVAEALYIDASNDMFSDESTTKKDIAKLIKKATRKTTHNTKTRSLKTTKASKNTIKMFDRHYCHECNRDFSTKTNLTRHMSTHGGQRPFECNVCGKGFTQNTSLKQHMYTHTGEKPYVCKICDRAFSQCKSMIFHMRRHTGEKPFPCDICGISFRQKDGLKNHLLKHHMISEQYGDCETNSCVICKEDMPSKYALEVHMKKHVNNHDDILSRKESAIFTKTSQGTKSNDELLKNDIAAMDNELLLNVDEITSSTHIVNVMGSSAAEPSRAKKYQCRGCFKCFSIKENLIRHFSIHTKLDNTDDPTNSTNKFKLDAICQLSEK